MDCKHEKINAVVDADTCIVFWCSELFCDYEIEYDDAVILTKASFQLREDVIEAGTIYIKSRENYEMAQAGTNQISDNEILEILPPVQLAFTILADKLKALGAVKGGSDG